jgi:RHS repeat-associated protein
VNGLPINYTLDLIAGLAQVLADGTNAYLYGRGRIGEQQPGGWQYHHGDALGSVRQLTNSGATPNLARSFEPFGSHLSSMGSTSTAYSFTGEQLDATGLTYLRARFYAAEIGRFLSSDPIIGVIELPATWNGYTYALNNPVLYTDPAGLQSQCGPFDLQCKSLEALRERAERCYDAADWGCLWETYTLLAVGGVLQGYNHAADHMFRYLYLQGDILYHPYRSADAPDTSDWVRDTPSVRTALPALTQRLLSLIHDDAVAGLSFGRVLTEKVPHHPNVGSEKDLYYAMNLFSLWAEADYSLSSCYEIEVSPTYWFEDEYDWHPGLAAGGAVPALGGFKDEWAAALSDHGLALEYSILGYWQGLTMAYIFPQNWLDLEVPVPPIDSRIVSR